MKTPTEQMDASQVFCPNAACQARGKSGEGTIISHGKKRARYRCKTCGKTFSAQAGTMFEGLRKPKTLIVMVVTLLAYGCPIQAIVQAFGLDERTVASWRERAGKHCQEVHQAVVQQGNLDLIHVQADAHSRERVHDDCLDGVSDAGLDARVVGRRGEPDA
jgi:transposase-like protein